MPRAYSSIEKIRAELAWVNETPDPNKCGDRDAAKSPASHSLLETDIRLVIVRLQLSGYRAGA